MIYVVATFLVCLAWLNDYYEIRLGEIIHHEGLLGTRREVFTTGEVRAVTVTQNLLGRVLHYGTVSLYNPALEKEIRMVGVSNPNRCQQLISQFLPEIKTPPSMVHVGGITTA